MTDANFYIRTTVEMDSETGVVVASMDCPHCGRRLSQQFHMRPWVLKHYGCVREIELECPCGKTLGGRLATTMEGNNMSVLRAVKYAFQGLLSLCITAALLSGFFYFENKLDAIMLLIPAIAGSLFIAWILDSIFSSVGNDLKYGRVRAGVMMDGGE